MDGKDTSAMISTTRMFKLLLRGAILLLVFAAVGQAAAQPPPPPGGTPPPPPPPTLPTTTDQCRDGGWQTFKVFKNQGDCVSFVATKGKNPPAK
jgi:hypothetical protein